MYCIECLKDWIKRKNHCPLCLRGGLATPTSATTRAATTTPSRTTSAGRRRLRLRRHGGPPAAAPDGTAASDAAAAAATPESDADDNVVVVGNNEELLQDPEVGNIVAVSPTATTSPVIGSSRSGLYVSMPEILPPTRRTRTRTGG